MKKLIVISCLIITTLCVKAQNFSPVGDGLSYAGVKSLSADTVHGILYAAGSFSHTGNGLLVNQVARWDGGQWDSISSGITPGSVGNAVKVFNNQVYFGGSFYSFGGGPDTGVAIFDGVNILPSANITLPPNNIGNCRGIISYGQDLYFVGYRGLLDGAPFNQIAKWDGASWTNYPMLDSLEGWPVVTAAVYNNELYVGGNFEGYGSAYMKDLARFNGTAWDPVGNGLTGFLTAINAMVIYDGKLVIAGGFKTINGDPGNCIAAWDGISWSQFGSGINGAYINALEVVGNDLYVGGFFSSAGATPAMNLARWDGAQWHSLGAVFHPNAVVLCLEFMNNELFIGGGFDSINGIPILNIAKYSILTGINEIPQLENEVKVYSTLTTGLVTIEVAIGELQKILVTDISGKRILVDVCIENEKKISLHNHPPGVYIIKVETSLGTVYRKVMLMDEN